MKTRQRSGLREPRPRPSSPSPTPSRTASKQVSGVGIAGKLEDSLTHTSNSVEMCQLIVQGAEMDSLRRTTVGKSERQLRCLIKEVQEGSSRPPPIIDLHWLNTHNCLSRIRLNTSKVSTAKCQSSEGRWYTSKSRP